MDSDDVGHGFKPDSAGVSLYLLQQFTQCVLSPGEREREREKRGRGDVPSNLRSYELLSVIDELAYIRYETATWGGGGGGGMGMTLVIKDLHRHYIYHNETSHLSESAPFINFSSCLHSSDLLAFISQYTEQTVDELLHVLMHVDVRYRIQELNLENGIFLKLMR